MGRPIKEMELQMRSNRGAKVERPEQTVRVPELVELFKHFHQMKHEHSMKHEAKWEEKLKKLDELIAAVKGIKLDTPKGTDLGPIMKLLADIQKEHTKIAADHAAMKAEYSDDDDDEPCTYKLTGKRDQRGLIDLEYGLTFTPIDK